MMVWKSLPSGVPFTPKLLGRDALGLNPFSCVDGLEKVDSFQTMTIFGVSMLDFRHQGTFKEIDPPRSTNIAGIL